MGDLRWWWEVVAESAVVDADGMYGGYDDEEEDGEEGVKRFWCSHDDGCLSTDFVKVFAFL